MWICCMPQDEKKEIEPTFINENCFKLVGIVSSKICL